VTDPYDICRQIRCYHQKNCYSPTREQVVAWCGSAEFFEQLITNDVIEVLPLYPEGPLVNVVLTEKGFRMATVERRAR